MSCIVCALYSSSVAAVLLLCLFWKRWCVDMKTSSHASVVERGSIANKDCSEFKSSYSEVVWVKEQVYVTRVVNPSKRGR